MQLAQFLCIVDCYTGKITDMDWCASRSVPPSVEPEILSSGKHSSCVL
jgi:hypothetical protein